MAGEYAIRYYPPRGNRPSTGVGGGTFGRLTAWGHSWVDTTFGNGPPNAVGGSVSAATGSLPRARDSRFPDRLAGRLGVTWPNFRSRGHSGELFLGVNNTTLPGYCAIQQLIRPENPTRAPYVATHGHHLIVNGLNDVALQGPFSAQVLNMWKHDWRGTIARLWAGGIFEQHTNAPTTVVPSAPTAFTVSGSWSPPYHPDGWSATTNYSVGTYVVQLVGATLTTYIATQAGINQPPNTSPTFWSVRPAVVACPWDPGRVIRVTATAGNFTDFTLPADYPGGYINVRLLGEKQGVQAGATVATITAPPAIAGGPNQTFTLATHNASIATVANSMVCQRIAVAKTGTTQNVRIAATTLAAGGRLAVDCVEIEDIDPPFIVAFTVAKPRSWDIYNQGSAPNGGVGTLIGTPRSGSTAPFGAQTEDTWLVAPNTALNEIVTEFGGSLASPTGIPSAPIMLLDGDVTMDGTLYPERYLDETHPSEIGDAYIAEAAYAAFGTLQTTFGVNAVARHQVDAVALWSIFAGAN